MKNYLFMFKVLENCINSVMQYALLYLNIQCYFVFSSGL
jgi:hypothetical protein